MVTFKGNMRKFIGAIVALLALASLAHAQVQTRSYVDSLITSLIPDNDTNAVSPANVRSVLTAIVDSSCFLGDANACPPITLGNIAVSGMPGITQSWAGASNLVSLDADITAASASANEAAALIRMTSSLGGTAGVYKIALGTEMTMDAGSGAGYALNSVLTINSGVGAFTGYALETDCNNFNEDYPLPNQEGYLGVMANCHAIASGSSTFPGSAAIQVGALTPTTFAWHAGLYFLGANLLKDYTIYDGTNSTTSYDDIGEHTTGICTCGTYSVSAIQGTGYAINGAGVSSFAQVLVSGGAAHAESIYLNSTFLEIQGGTGGIAFPNAANSANLLVLTNAGAAAFAGPISMPQATWGDTQTCAAGQIIADANFVYVCTATNVVKRTALTTF